MKQEQFVASRKQRWEHYQALLAKLTQREKLPAAGEFPAQYRRLCNDLAVASARGYSLGLIRQLQSWIRDGHALLYRSRPSLAQNFVAFFSRDFPSLVRAEWRLLALCSLLLFGPMLWLFWQIGSTPEFVYRVLSPEAVESYERMYARSAGGRGADNDVMMFAFYIMNNIGVSLRTFAGGLLFGIGSAVILLFNGVMIGAVAAHLSFEGYHQNFWTFVIGHGAFELPAIVLAGVAGLRMGLSLLLPGPFSRLDALRISARRAVTLLYGVIAMLVLAAGLEAFWSASPAPAAIKYVVGGLLWLVVLAYFSLAGRGSTSRAN
ncbi:MAG: stage II sporulation protein M [Wenzhouxiangella sp.]|nr:stage II sporulation protein M [Wenzhouxiangella sp.]